MHTKFSCQRFRANLSWAVGASYFTYVSVTQFCIGAIRASLSRCKALPLLGDFINHIISSRTEKKMIRVDALRDVALMKNAQPLRNYACMQFIANSMSEKQLAFSPAEFQSSVPIGQSPPYPYPAFTRFIRSCIKHCAKVLAWCFHGDIVYSANSVLSSDRIAPQWARAEHATQVAEVGGHVFFVPKA